MRITPIPTDTAIASQVFGTKGYALASGLLSTLLLGWFAVQTGITPQVESPRFLNNQPLDKFTTIYLANVDRLDPECSLPGLVLNEPRERKNTRYILNNSFGMLGINSVVIIGKV